MPACLCHVNTTVTTSRRTAAALASDFKLPTVRLLLCRLNLSFFLLTQATPYLRVYIYIRIRKNGVGALTRATPYLRVYIYIRIRKNGVGDISVCHLVEPSFGISGSTHIEDLVTYFNSINVNLNNLFTPPKSDTNDIESAYSMREFIPDLRV